MNDKQLTILDSNVQGIQNSFFDILDLVLEKNPDIVSLQEIMITEKNLLYNTDIKNYKKIEYRRKHKKGGGLITYVKDTHEILSITKTTTENYNEFIITKIKTNNNTIIHHTNFYNPLSKNIDTIQIEKILNENENNIITGDLNCKHPSWGSTNTNEGGHKLKNTINKNKYNTTYHNNHTHYNVSTKKHDTLDISIWKNKNYNIQPINQHKINSDHTPILFVLKSNKPIYKIIPPTYITQYHKVNWTEANEELNNIIIRTNNTIEIDHSIKKIEQKISEIISKIKEKHTNKIKTAYK